MKKFDYLNYINDNPLLKEDNIEEAVPQLKVGDEVIVKEMLPGKRRYIQGYTGKGKIVKDVNSFGRFGVKLYREKGYSDFNDISWHEPIELQKA